MLASHPAVRCAALYLIILKSLPVSMALLKVDFYTNAGFCCDRVSIWHGKGAN